MFYNYVGRATALPASAMTRFDLAELQLGPVHRGHGIASCSAGVLPTRAFNTLQPAPRLPPNPGK